MQENDTSYRANVLLKPVGVKIDYTEEQLTEYIKCSQDPIYFIETYMTIIHIDRGVIPFKLYDFQKELIQAIHKNRRVVGKISRQSGKSITTIAYVLWSTLFKDNQNIAILANKGSLARDLLDRYQRAYENIPKWLQQGVVIWNKGNIELENGSKVVASSTSSSAIRGGSFSHVILDEFAHIHNNLAENFFNSVYPVISSGETSKITVISTPFGLNHFFKLFSDAKARRNDYACIDIHWTRVPGRTQTFKEEYIRNTNLRQWQQEMESCCENTTVEIDGQEMKMGDLYNELKLLK